jgi:hypothetical protein
VPLFERTSAGHQLGVLLATMLLVLLAAGVWIGFSTSRRAPSTRARQRAGTVLLAALALVPVLAIAALLGSSRGLPGTISHDLHTATNLNPHVSNSADRLTALGSVRALYWDQALKVWEAHAALGVGVGGYSTARLRFATDRAITVQHAHGFLAQTLADLGIVGVALSLALLAFWFAAAARTARPWDLHWVRAPRTARAISLANWRLRRAREPYTPERVESLCLLAVVFTFGAHSFIDWTWFVPGTACTGLLCAGWLAGRAPSEIVSARTPTRNADNARQSPTAVRRLRRLIAVRIRLPVTLPLPSDMSASRTLASGALVAFALTGAWAQWQPLRSSDAAQAALIALEGEQVTKALVDAQLATRRDPLSATALANLAVVQTRAGQTSAAQATLQRAVRLQPANPETWLALGEFEETTAHDPRTALVYFTAALYLDPSSQQITSSWVQARRRATNR